VESAVGQLDASAFAAVLADDLEIGPTAAASSYARQGVGSETLRVLDFAATVVVAATGHVIQHTVGLINAIRVAEPYSSEQRVLFIELTVLMNQALER